MRLGIAQIRTRAGDFEATAKKMAEYSRSAAEKGVDLLVFPSTTLSGATPVPLQDREGFLLDTAASLMGIAEGLSCSCLVPFATELMGQAGYEALLFTKDDVVPLRMMSRLKSLVSSQAGESWEADDEDTDEESGDCAGRGDGFLDDWGLDLDDDYEALGGLDYLDGLGEKDGGEDDEPPLATFEFAGLTLGLAFDYDDLDDFVDRGRSVDAIVFFSRYGYAVNDPSSALGASLTEGRFGTDAQESGAVIVGVGPVGCYDSQVFGGSSFVVTPGLEVLAQGPGFEEALVVANVPSAPDEAGSGGHQLMPEVFDPPLYLWESLVLGIQDAAAARGRAAAAVAVDGSLSSFVCAALATDALGPANVRAFVLKRGSMVLDDLSKRLVSALRLEDAEYIDVAAYADEALAKDVLLVQAAAWARSERGLVLDGATKTQLALGLGPSAALADLYPLADVYQSDVYELCRLRNTVSPVIPRPRKGAPGGFSQGLPLPWSELGLKDVRGTEARVAVVDKVLERYLEWQDSVTDIADAGTAPQVAEAVVGLLRRSEATRPALTGRALALSCTTLDQARAPSGLAWHDRARGEGERLDADSAARLAAQAAAQLFESVREDEGDDGEQAPANAPARRAQGAMPPDPDSELRDMLGYLRDFSLGGAFDDRDGQKGGSWGLPFSEN